MNLTFIISAAVLAAVLLLAVGFLLGYYFRTIRSALQKLQTDYEERRAEEAGVQQVITTTPQLIREKQQPATSDQEEESQIITVKSPRQLRADRDRHLEEDLDKLTGKPN